MTRIGIVSLMGGLQWGGSEALWYSIALHALQQGDEVFVSVYDWGKPHKKLEYLQQKGAVIHYRKRYNAEAGTFGKIIRFIQHRKPSLNKDYQSLINFKPECIFISQGDSFDLAIHHRPLFTLIAKHAIPFSFVCHSHSQFSLIPPVSIFPGAKEIFNLAQQVYFVSKRQWQLTERRLVSKVANGQFTWNPINMEMPDQSLAWIEDNFIQMAIVGSLDGSKGQDTAFEVLSKSQWKQRNWKLNIYGKGEGENYLHKLADFYNISDNVFFHGYVDDIKNIWQTNQILLLPSAGEGMPISLVEAMACGRPAVVTDVGGNTELIVENQTGFVAASPSTDCFAYAMEKAWNSQNTWQKLGLNSFEKINSILDLQPEIKIYESLKNGK
jgi:glycosyltransferase involved in cell wall biosynthesis